MGEARVYLFVFLDVRASVHGGADRLSACLPACLLAYLRIFLSRARSCLRVGACAATVIARMPYDTGEIGSFGTNRPCEPLSRCICKAVSNCARARTSARARADTGTLRASDVRHYASLEYVSHVPECVLLRRMRGLGITEATNATRAARRKKRKEERRLSFRVARHAPR